MARYKEKILGNIKMKKDKNNIETVVLQCFLRVLKNNNSYLLYRRCVNNGGIMKSLLKKQLHTSSDNPFSKASSTYDVINTLQRITNDMSRNNGKNGIKDMDKYEHVTMTINHLLHFFMETNGVSMQRLCELGEEIYGMSCNKLFGDTIEDIQKQNEEELNSIEDMNALKAKLFQDFIRDLQNGKVSSSTNFDDYMASRMQEINAQAGQQEMNPIPGNQVGHMLGRGPEDMGNMRPGWLDSDD